MGLDKLYKSFMTESLDDHNYDLVKTVMHMFDVEKDIAIELVNRVQDFNGPAMISALINDDKVAFAKLYMKAKENAMNEGVAWGRSGSKIVRKFRCSGGPRHGRVVSKPAQCFAPKDIKKSINLKRTTATKGKKMARKRKKTMRTNAASKRVQALNRK